MLGAVLLVLLQQASPPQPAVPSASQAAELAAKIARGDDATIEAALAELSKLEKEGAAELWKLRLHERVWVRTLALSRLSRMSSRVVDLLPQVVERLGQLSRPDHGSLASGVDGYGSALIQLGRIESSPDFKKITDSSHDDLTEEFLSTLDRCLMVELTASMGAADLKRLLELLTPQLSLSLDTGWSDIGVALSWAASRANKEAAAIILQHLPGASESERLGLLCLAAGVGNQGRELIPAIGESVRSESSALRAAGLEALADLRTSAGAGVERALKTLAADPSPMVRLELARVLAWCAEDTAGSLQLVLQMVERGDPATRRNALQVWRGELFLPFGTAHLKGMAGVMVQPSPSRAVPLLTRVLADASNGNRCAASKLLEMYGKDAASALPALRRLSSDANYRVRKGARSAVTRIELAVEAANPKAKEPANPPRKPK